MTDKTREEYLKTKKGKEAQEKAREKYDRENPEKRPKRPLFGGLL